MFFINDEKIDLAKAAQSDNLLAKQIAAKIEELQSTLGRKPMRIKWREGLQTINRKSRLKEGKKGVFTPFTVSINNKQGTNRVTYCEQAQVEAFGVKKYYPRGEWYRGSKVLGLDNIELAVYYALFCPYVKSRTLIIEDRESEAKNRTEARQKVAAYYYHLYGEASPLSSDMDKLIEIAQAFGIQNASQMEVNLLKDEIFKMVELREATSKDGVQTFQRFIEGSDELIRPLADIQTLCDDGELFLDRNEYSWKFKGGNKLLQLNPTDAFDISTAKNKLAIYITGNKDAAEVVSGILLNKPKPELPHVSAGTDLGLLEWSELRAICTDRGINISKKKRQHLEEELKALLEK